MVLGLQSTIGARLSRVLEYERRAARCEDRMPSLRSILHLVWAASVRLRRAHPTTETANGRAARQPASLAPELSTGRSAPSL